MSDVILRQTDAGDLQLGAYVEGGFVPLVTVAAAQVAQLVENAHDRGDTEPEANGEGAAIGKRATHAELDAHAAEHDVADYPADGTKAEKLAAIEAAAAEGEDE